MKTFIIVAVFLCFLYAPSKQWGYAGHKITAILADNMLTDNAEQVVARLINNSIPNIASLPDSYDHTKSGRWSEPLHYADLPHNVSGFVLSRDCPPNPGCVVSSIHNFTKLTSKRINGMPWDHPGEPTPLEFLVHFVGDIHQPLHVGYGDDEGGNLIHVEFFGSKANLHSVWDELIIKKYNNDIPSLAQELQDYIDSNQDWANSVASSQDVIGWANESYSLVKSDLYDFPDDDGSGDNPIIGNLYYNKELPNVKKRLMMGGLRLGYLINSLADPQNRGSINLSRARRHRNGRQMISLN